MTHTIEKTVYSFSELGDSAKERAREWYREGLGRDSYWYESVLDDVETVAGLFGLTISRQRGRQESAIYFNDREAGFEGDYTYRKGGLALVREYCGGTDAELMRIVTELQDVQRRSFYALTARTSWDDRRGMRAHVCDMRTEDDLPEGDGIHDELMSFASWVRKQLREQEKYSFSDESADETILANDYEFTEEGCSV